MSRFDRDDDRRVVPFRRPQKPGPAPVALRKSLMLFAGLLAAGLLLGLLFNGALVVAEMATAFFFALAIGTADFVRRRREHAA